MHGSDLQKINDLIARHELGKPATLGCFDNAPSSSGGSGSRPSSASSGAVEAEAPPAKRAKTEPASEAGLAEKPFDHRPERFKSSDLTEVPLPNGLAMLKLLSEGQVRWFFINTSTLIAAMRKIMSKEQSDFLMKLQKGNF